MICERKGAKACSSSLGVSDSELGLKQSFVAIGANTTIVAWWLKERIVEKSLELAGWDGEIERFEILALAKSR